MNCAGGQHAREWLAPSSLVHTTERLLENAELGEAQTAKALDAFTITIFPVLNPGGTTIMIMCYMSYGTGCEHNHIGDLEHWCPHIRAHRWVHLLSNKGPNVAQECARRENCNEKWRAGCQFGMLGGGPQQELAGMTCV